MYGLLVLIGSIIGIIIYGWLLFSFATIVLQITAFVAIAAVLGILAWIGYTMATTTPPAAIEDISESAVSDVTGTGNPDREKSEDATGSSKDKK